MKKGLNSIGIMVAATLYFLGQTYAQSAQSDGERGPFPGSRHGKRDHRGRNPHIERLLENSEVAKKLGISDEQRTRIMTRMNDIYAREKVLMEQQQAAAVKQVTLLVEKEVDKQALFAAVEETGRVRTEIAKLRIEKILVIREELTDEQQMKLRTFMHQNRRRKESGEERPMRRRPPTGERPGQQSAEK